MQEMFEELVAYQKAKIFACAKKIVPHITEDDLLQPNDFPGLELNPYFRYEEGILEGLLTARMAYLAQQKQKGLVF